MFKFFGAKYRLADTYPEPIHDLIVEPFAGSAAYAVRHRTTSRVVLIEKDARVVALWRRLLAMDVTDLLAIPDPIPGDTCDDLLVAFAAGRTTRDTPSTFQVSPRMAQRFRPMVNRIASVLDECRHFEVIEGDYTDAPDVEATWFIDPPYQGQGGRWDRTRGGRYLHSNRDIDFTALARWCRERTGQVVVCEQAGADWLPWNGGVLARDGTHAAYGEVWWTNMHPAVGKHATETAEQFAGCTKANCRYRVPASWSWSPEPPAPVTGDDLRERIARAIYAKDGWGDPWEGTGTAAIKYGRMADAVLAVLPTPAAPVPPWPGAVMSGLVDEDGVPTWLAQAGQVRGEQVRRRSDFGWVNNDQMVAHLDTVWVEVRAPRAVPEPETERVPWWEALGRLGLAGDPFVEVGSDDEGPWVRVVEGGTKLHSPVDPDGTVEVLVDGES